MAAVVAEQRPQQPRSEQNTPAAFVLALSVHALLVAALWISVQWNVEPSGAVVVELWSGAPAAGPAAAPEPLVVTPPAPPAPPKAEPEPEKPDAEIVVKQEKKTPPKAEPDPKKIEAEKRRIEADRQREAEARRRDAEKKELEAERKKQAEAAAQAAERRREDERREAVRKAEEARMLAQAAGGSGSGAGGRPGGTAAAGGGSGDPTYAEQLVSLIRPRIIFAVPESTPASVQAVFQVDLLPTGEILAVRKLKASGLPGYDEAVERAIRRTDPFPRKRDGTVERNVIIEFRPVEK